MATTTNNAWVPTAEEVRRIVAELRPVIDECVSRSHKFLDTASAATAAGVTWWALKRAVPAASTPPPAVTARAVAQVAQAARSATKGVDYARTFLAATVPRATRTSSSRSFFIGRRR